MKLVAQLIRIAIFVFIRVFKIALCSLLCVRPVLAIESYSVIDSSLKLGNDRVCLLDKKPKYAIESYDNSAILISQTDYVVKQDLVQCQVDRKVHVFSIPSNVGVLSDINISKGIYVALDFVSTQPFLYLATVARVGSSKNLVSIRGAYITGMRPRELRRFAFGGSGDAGMSIISPDGKFVAPDGKIDCTDGAYPGVWSVEGNRRVLTSDDACSALFQVTLHARKLSSLASSYLYSSSRLPLDLSIEAKAAKNFEDNLWRRSV